MKQTVNFYDFTDAFTAMNRANQFSYEALQALFYWLEDFEEDTGEEIELDVIALCCDFTEYASINEFWDDYGKEKEEYPDVESIENETTVIRLGNGGFIIHNF